MRGRETRRKSKKSQRRIIAKNKIPIWEFYFSFILNSKSSSTNLHLRAERHRTVLLCQFELEEAYIGPSVLPQRES